MRSFLFVRPQKEKWKKCYVNTETEKNKEELLKLKGIEWKKNRRNTHKQGTPKSPNKSYFFFINLVFSKQREASLCKPLFVSMRARNNEIQEWLPWVSYEYIHEIGCR